MLAKCQQPYQFSICFTCLHCVDCDLYKYWCSECRVGLSDFGPPGLIIHKEKRVFLFK